jgi:hypothetical protein
MAAVARRKALALANNPKPMSFDLQDMPNQHMASVGTGADRCETNVRPRLGQRQPNGWPTDGQDQCDRALGNSAVSARCFEVPGGCIDGLSHR